LEDYFMKFYDHSAAGSEGGANDAAH
jgi:hypothetical protein